MMMKRILTFLLMAALLCMTGLTANAAPRATSITFSKTKDATVRVGYTITRTAVTTPEGIPVTYKSSDSSVVTVNENGKIVGRKPGKAIITASAGGLETSYKVTIIKADKVTGGTKVFDGYKVTVADQAIPAVNMRGKANDPNVMCFVSAADKEIGTILYSDYSKIITKNKKVLTLKDGGTLAVPPDGRSSWNEWFADEFNKHRGLDANSRKEADESYAVKTIEEYQQEIIRLTNIEREKVGLASLTEDSDAMDFAQIRSQEVVSSYSHKRPNGEYPRVNDSVVSENIGVKTSPEAQIKSWMKSEGHRANMLNPDAYAIGVGVYQSDSGALYWVQIFIW